MEKEILKDYIDACKLVKELQADIKKLQKRQHTILTDKVSGSNPEFPFQEQSFKIEGIAEQVEDAGKISREIKILETQQAKAKDLKLRVEEWLQTVPFRMQRIIRYRFFDKMSWEEVADRVKCKAGGEAMRKEYERFMKKN